MRSAAGVVERATSSASNEAAPVVGSIVADFFFRQGKAGIGLQIDVYRNNLDGEMLYGAILLASHNMAEVERLCGHVLMLKRGRLVDSGSPADLLARYGRDDLEEVFLDIARDRRAG